jgi:hypothetical protein
MITKMSPVEGGTSMLPPCVLLAVEGVSRAFQRRLSVHLREAELCAQRREQCMQPRSGSVFASCNTSMLCRKRGCEHCLRCLLGPFSLGLGEFSHRLQFVRNFLDDVRSASEAKSEFSIGTAH